MKNDKFRMINMDCMGTGGIFCIYHFSLIIYHLLETEHTKSPINPGKNPVTAKDAGFLQPCAVYTIVRTGGRFICLIHKQLRIAKRGGGCL